MFITQSFKKSLIVEQFQGNYLKCSFYRIFQDYHFETRHNFTLTLPLKQNTNECLVAELRRPKGPPSGAP